MIVIIDNYDSFTYNLVQYLGELNAELEVFRNDEISVEELQSLHPSHIVISPGPGDPQDAGISRQAIHQFAGQVPILGVCLGHQCIAEVYGGKVVRATRLMHGKTSKIYHTEAGIFAGLPNPFVAMRYHSLIVKKPLPPEIQVTAYTRSGEVMGLQHQRYPVYGVQFHPESILTESGKQIFMNFLK